MALGLIVKSGRVLTAKLLMGQTVEGISHCAIGGWRWIIYRSAKPTGTGYRANGT
jgi:hypothetical protein